MALTLAQLAECCAGSLQGDGARLITQVSNLRDADAHTISLYSDRHYAQDLAHSRAGAVITSAALAKEVEGDKLIVDNPLLALACVIEALQDMPSKPEEGTPVSASARLASSVELGEGVSIGANVVIGRNVRLGDYVCIGAGTVIGDGVSIGESTRIDANVTIYHACSLGRRGHISAGAIIGADGFGFAETHNEEGPAWVAIPQIAAVRIGDDVHIGANTTIDRGSLEDTVIGDGVIIDNLVQIAHNVNIGRHTAIAGCAGIAGSTRIGQNCKIGGRASILGHIEICDNVVVFADSYVTKSIKSPGIYSAALPAMPLKKWHRVLARFRRGAA